MDVGMKAILYVQCVILLIKLAKLTDMEKRA